MHIPNKFEICLLSPGPCPHKKEWIHLPLVRLVILVPEGYPLYGEELFPTWYVVMLGDGLSSSQKPSEWDYYADVE